MEAMPNVGKYRVLGGALERDGSAYMAPPCRTHLTSSGPTAWAGSEDLTPPTYDLSSFFLSPVKACRFFTAAMGDLKVSNL
jgi:hypothetical protein